MCGIAGIISSDKSLRDSYIDASVNLLSHRGPDAKGVWTDDRKISLGHTRLSILDLSVSGNQPMTSSCGRYILVFNGEIYNHLELRNIYLEEYEFKSTSDTETILELFRLFGITIQNEFVGMWAFLLWDTEEENLSFSRDRFGQKPLYYAYLEDAIVFSSDIKPILSRLKTTINETMSVEYLSTGNYGHLGQETFFKEIKQVLPSHWGKVDLNSKELFTQAYWDIPILSEAKGQIADQEFLRELNEIIIEAVTSQTLSDVPIGITLSGGIDSSIVAGILSKHYSKKFNVFTAQTPNSKWDETKYVDAVLKRIEKEKYSLFSTDLNNLMSIEDLDMLLNVQEEPFGDPSIMAHHQLMTLAKENGTKVILGGQGADELFFGYSHSVNSVLAHCIRNLKLGIVIDWMLNGGLTVKLWVRIWFTAIFPKLEKNLRTRSRYARRQGIPAEVLLNAREVEQSILTDVNLAWINDIRGACIPHLVHYDDRNGMSQGIEGRMPFFDHRIIEKLGTLKPSEFIKGAKRKSVLRRACEEYLPIEVLNRKDKIGFYTPLLKILDSWSTTKTDKATSSELSRYLTNPNIASALVAFRKISWLRWSSIFNTNLEK